MAHIMSSKSRAAVCCLLYVCLYLPVSVDAFINVPFKRQYHDLIASYDSLKLSSSTSSGQSTTDYSTGPYDQIDFTNVGFEGYYYHVESITEDSCTCKLSTKKTKFSGPNAPLNEELSVHFRGPLILHSFGYYVANSYTLNGTSNTDNWNRMAYYDSSTLSTENVTFLTNAGTNISCLGNALTYADTDGISASSEATVLAADTEIHSGEEFAIFSNVSCGKSGYSKDCGVYRSGIPAYHGFYGTTKMFLFNFSMPTETNMSKSTESGYDMPAIWLLNAHIPRTAQYPLNNNCSCWATGCGEFDIFEVMNTTQSTRLYSTIHDYQGISDISDGIQVHGYIERESGPSIGGVIFDSDGSTTVFVSNMTTLDTNITAADLESWILNATQTISQALPTITQSAASLASSLPSALTLAAGVLCCLLFSMTI